MAGLTVEQIAAQKIAEELAVKEAAELKATIKKEALRDLSKELGINAFEPSELKKKFDEYTKWKTDQKSEQDILQDRVDLLDKEKTIWEKKELDFNSKFKASELGIAQDNLADALKLAGGNPDNLAEVIKKYPMFVSKEGITIGITQSNGAANLTGQTEVEKYAAKFKDNPYYNPRTK